MTQHIEVRIKERFEQLGYKPEAIKESLGKISELEEQYPKANVGFLLRKFDKNMATDFSNGDELWLILRDGRAITCFLRRSTQTNNQRRSLEQQLQVDYTIKLNCLDDSGWQEVRRSPSVSIRNNEPIDWDAIEAGMREVIERNRARQMAGIPALTATDALRLINGRNYNVLSADEVLDGNDEIICRVGSAYITLADSPPPNSYYTEYLHNAINEDNTER